MSEYIVKCKGHVSISGSTIQFPEYIDLNQEIVRCKDCKHLNCIKDKKGRIIYYGCFVFRASVAPDGFCAWGERKVVEK